VIIGSVQPAARGDETAIDPTIDPLAEVWALPSVPAIAGDAFGVLDREEQDRAARFVRDEDRDAFITARAALRHVVGAALKTHPAAIRFVRNPFGKLLLCDSAPGFDFSVSHAGGLCVIALTWSGAVGVDIERRRDVPDRRRIAAGMCGEGVMRQLADTPAEQENDVFLRLWTAAEALVKATGRGLAGTWGRIPVSLAADGVPRIETAEWTLHELESLPGCVGSLVVRAGGRGAPRCRLTRTSFLSLAGLCRH
jgi:4'-phosphopantetheinyl transferase